jgi:hypothetical protein
MLQLTMGPYTFTAKLETESAPKTVEAFRGLLPLRAQIIHARWSGEALWIPFGERRLGIESENHTSHPAPGEILLYPGGLSEMEILVPYGASVFASKVGQLAGNHFATILDDRDTLRALGHLVLWEGAQNAHIREA